ncbi:PASTA domain protein [Bacteroidales bacterium KA00344]|nr:PASTA domain protein [Bacteroidales bacterium KA00344]
MRISEFFGKFKSCMLWGNLVAMIVTILLLAVGVKIGLDRYTHHGESIAIPKLLHKDIAEAEDVANRLQLKIETVDTGYVKHLPPGCVLEQSPAPGERVKSGHAIYVTINATQSPTIKLPDIIDNSSLREAMAKLTAMGFNLTPPQFVAGEKDWVYGVLMNGKQVVYGDRVPIDAKLTVQAGNGMRDLNDDVNYIDPEYTSEDDNSASGEFGDFDDFEEVGEVPAEPAGEVNKEKKQAAKSHSDPVSKPHSPKKTTRKPETTNE